MDAYELEPDKIINWAVDYADYDDLESVAKAVYSVYVTRRKEERPNEHIKNKENKKKLQKDLKWRN